MQAKSPTVTDTAVAKALRQQLRELQAPESKRFRLALLLALANLILLIGQYGILAWMLNQWLQASLNGQWQAAVGNPLYLAFSVLALILFLRPILHYGREQLCLTASENIRAHLREQLMQRIALPAAQFEFSDSDGALASQLLEQVDALDAYLQRYVVQAQFAVLAPLVLILVIFPFSALAATLMLLTAPLVPLFMIIVGQAAASSSRKQLHALGRLSGRFLDLIRGMRTLQQLEATEQAQQRIADSAESYRQRTMAVLRLAFLSSAVLEFFAALSIALVAVYLGLGLLGVLPWAKEQIPVPYVGALFILLLAPEFYAPLRQLGSDYHAKGDAEAALTELQPLLDKQIWQHSGTEPLAHSGAPSISARQLRVVSPDARQRLYLPELEVPSGSRLLIQGESGAGKSTFLQVLLGALEYQGELLINQQNFQHLCLADWFEQVDFLPQAPRFISGSVADNLRLAQPSATQEQMLAVLAEVGLAEVISERGLGLSLGERGLGLSGGQLSRLALAQLVLRARPVWLLDEPAAQLDPESRLLLHQLLARLSRGRTLILVSHAGEGLEWVEQRLQLEPAQGDEHA